LDFALSRGNTLIHCERGQYRSPTMLIAWLISRGYNTTKAMNTIGAEYFKEGWEENYRKNRALWIDKLRIFEKKHSVIKTYWSKTNAKLIAQWESPCQQRTDEDDEDSLLDSNEEQDPKGTL